MSTTKLIDNNRRTHAAKVLAQASKKNQQPSEEIHSAETSSNEEVNETQLTSEYNDAFIEQYKVIREDVLKLREDLGRGYDLLKEWVEEKISVKSLISVISK